MAWDVITLGVTWVLYGQRLETTEFKIPHRVLQGSHWPTASDHNERNESEERGPQLLVAPGSTPECLAKVEPAEDVSSVS